MIHSLAIDGIFNGAGSVLSFLPVIVTLFFFLSLLEDSGYMARECCFSEYKSADYVKIKNTWQSL